MSLIDPEFFRKTASYVLDLVYPPQCEICHEPLNQGRHICPSCHDRLPRIKAPYCDKCGEVFEGNITDAFTCPNCSQLEYDFSFCRPVLQSSDAGRDLIHSLKYGRSIHLAADLARIATEAFEDPRLLSARVQRWTLIPVPLHWSRLQSRHFNQAREIVRHLARMLDLPWCDALQRRRATTTQTALSRRHRLKNLKGAISLSRAGRRWLMSKPAGAILFDDVFTTGATAQECSSTLKKSGIENRVVVTVMRG